MKRALVVLSLLAAPAAAATPPSLPPSLIERVPDGAVLAAVVESGALELGRVWFAQSSDMEKDIGGYFVKRLGVDLTRVDGAALWSTSLGKVATVGGFLRLRDGATPALRGARRTGCGGAALVSFGPRYVAAAAPGGLVAGDEAEVCRGLAVANKRAPAVGAQSPLSSLVTRARGADLAAAIVPGAVDDAEVRMAAANFGVQIVTLLFRPDGQIVIEARGDAAKLRTAQALVENNVRNGLAQLQRQHDRALADESVPFEDGLTAVVSYDQVNALWKEMAPRLEGDALVSRYRYPQLKGMTSIALVGVLAAVAIPAFMKYVRRAKTVEAVTNLRRIATGAEAYAIDQAPAKKARFAFPKSTDWTPGARCCGQPGDKCAPDVAAWQQPTWRALDFGVADPHYYQYRVTSTGKGKSARIVVEARGDLDCDGIWSTFKYEITVDDKLQPHVGDLQTENEIE